MRTIRLSGGGIDGSRCWNSVETFTAEEWDAKDDNGNDLFFEDTVVKIPDDNDPNHL